MNLDEKIGQLFIFDMRNLTQMTTEMKEFMDKYKPGGFIVFSSNIENKDQLTRFLEDVHKANTSSEKLFVTVDEEGGRVSRLGNKPGFINYGDMLSLGNSLDTNLAFQVGEEMGQMLYSVGINMNMAPILDIWSNPNNTVIGNRAFGTTPEQVMKMAFSLAEGLMKSQIIPVGKHFPGHGDTITDSHISMPVVTKSIKQLEKSDLLPFIKAANVKFPAIMTSHILANQVSNNPTSLSKEFLTDYYRNTIGYNGLLVTDSLKMKGLTNYYNEEEIYISALLAGNDILLMPQDMERAHFAIKRAYEEGVITDEHINLALERISFLKQSYLSESKSR